MDKNSSGVHDHLSTRWRHAQRIVGVAVSQVSLLDQLHPAAWEFWVVSARTLDEKLSTQKSVGCASLDCLAERIGWSQIKAAVEHLIG